MFIVFAQTDQQINQQMLEKVRYTHPYAWREDITYKVDIPLEVNECLYRVWIAQQRGSKINCDQTIAWVKIDNYRVRMQGLGPKKRNTRSDYLWPIDVMSVGVDLPSRQVTPLELCEAQAQQHRMGRVLNEALSILPIRTQRILRKWMHGLVFKTIGKEEGITETRVSQIVNKAYSLLRPWLIQHGHTLQQ